MQTIAHTLADARNALARMLATRPLPKVTDAVLANPLHTRSEVDETTLAIGVQLGQIADYYARLRADEAVDGVDLPREMHNYMRTKEGREYMLALILSEDGVREIIDTRVNTIVTERLNNATIRNRWHVPSLFSWLGAFIGAVLGIVLGVVLNTYIDANPVNGTVDGKQVVVGSIIDSLPGQIGIVAGCAIMFAALGAALWQRRESNN